MQLPVGLHSTFGACGGRGVGVVIEHNLAIIRRAGWLVDLGPGAGRHGGQVLYEGPVAGISETATAGALAAST